MKKNLLLIFALVICLFVTSCTKKNEFTIKDTKDISVLSKVTYPSDEKQFKTLDKYYQDNLEKFSNKVTKSIFTKNANHVFSPVSLYIALSMLTEGISDVEVLKNMESFLETSFDDMRKISKDIYETNYYKTQEGRTYLANSIWIANRIDVKSEYVEMLKNHYYAQSYHVDFSSDKVKQKIIDWINHYTEDLLALTKENYLIEDDIAMLLLNTIYFDNNWKIEFNERGNIEDTFYITDQKKTKATYMNHSISTIYFKGRGFIGTTDYFYNGNKIDYIMPESNDFVMDFNNYHKQITSSKEFNVNLFVPKFDYKVEYNLNEVLIQNGLGGIYKRGNLSKINEDIFVKIVKQNAGIKISEKGLKAAAVTSIISKIDSEGPIYETITLKLEKPFYYIIRDNNNIPLFVGYVCNPNN